MRDIRRIVIHCADTPPSMNIGVEKIDSWHRERGWSEVGYHGVIRRDGKYEPGRDIERAGAHAYGHNADSVAVCLVGGRGEDGGPENNFTAAQMKTLAALVTAWQRQFGVSDENIIGHRDLLGVTKACPAFDVRSWWAGLNGDAA